jgi:LysM repeat protein
MATAGDVADWWDKQHQESKKALDQFVDDNPNLFGVLVATTMATAMDLGAGAVDALRFGQGASEGGVKGFGKDALRLLTLAGPLGKAAKFLQVTTNARLARMIVDTGGRSCGWQSATQAMRQTGTRAFAAVEDLANALNRPLLSMQGTSLSRLVAELSSIGARIGPIKPIVGTPQEALNTVRTMTQNDGSVTMLAVFGKRDTKEIGHAIYAFRDAFGRLRFLDRGGSAGKLGEVFDDLGPLAKKYRVDAWRIDQAVTIENVFAKFAQGISELGNWVLGIEVAIAPAFTVKENEVAAQTFLVHKVIVEQGRKALESPAARWYVVKSGDWLSKISKAEYNDMYAWPVIYIANRDVIGPDPDKIKPGQRLIIPDLPNISF